MVAPCDGRSPRATKAGEPRASACSWTHTGQGGRAAVCRTSIPAGSCGRPPVGVWVGAHGMMAGPKEEAWLAWRAGTVGTGW